MDKEHVDYIFCKENEIVWEKWIDPMSTEEIKKAVNKIKQRSEDFESEDDEIVDNKYMKCIVDPVMGVIPIPDHSKEFNYWMGYTNFNITAQVVTAIEKTDGVEILNIVTNHRFRLGIAKYYRDRDVMAAISSNIKKIKKTNLLRSVIIELPADEHVKVIEEPDEGTQSSLNS